MSTPTAEIPRPEIVMAKTKGLEVHPWHKANVPSSNNSDKVEADMRIYGYRREHPLLVSSLSGTVLDGATRLSIATTSYLPANYLLPLAEVPAIVVPCETVQDEIDTIARTVLTTRQLTPGQYELLAYTYMKTLSATLVQAQKSGAGKKKGKKKNGSAGSADPLAVKGPEVVTATSPDAVVEKQHRRDARAETAKLFKVPELELKRLKKIESRPDATDYFRLMREGQMTAKGVEMDIRRDAKKEAAKQREDAAKKMAVPESWRDGDGKLAVKIGLKECETKFKLAVTNVEHLAAVSTHVDPTGFLLLIVDDWQSLRNAAEAAAKSGFDANDLLIGDYSRDREPGCKFRGTLGMALLCRRASTEFLGGIDRVENALAEDVMPPARMLSQIIAATTIANEGVLITGGTAEQYTTIKKLNRHPFVISVSHDEYIKGVAAIGELKTDPPACLVSPETLCESSELQDETESVVPVAAETEAMPVVMVQTESADEALEPSETPEGVLEDQHV